MRKVYIYIKNKIIKIKYFIKTIIKIFPLKIGRLQGGCRQSSWLDYITYIITTYKLVDLNMSVNAPFRNDFLKNIEYYLDSKIYSKIK